MRLAPLLAAAFAILTLRLGAEPTEIRYLSGAGSDDTVLWEFKVNGGRNSGAWKPIPVPSNWEMQGFGAYRYWKDWGDRQAPDSLGEYRHRFEAPAAWEGKRIDLVFGGVMTDAEVFLNGQLAGPVHQGGFYQFRYDATELLRLGGENLLEVKVQKYSDNESVNLAEREADYWLFGGIYRPVWLEARPQSRIERIAVDARGDGSYDVEVFLGGDAAGATLTATVKTVDGATVASSAPAAIAGGDSPARLSGAAPDALPWSAEWPNLYALEVVLARDGKPLHVVSETVGFRTIDLRPRDGFYINGEKVILKGSNRHTIWPDTGRATNAALSEADVQLMKDMNMNAVRMSHYPPDPHFLEACDRLGLYVIDELGGWQKAYDSEIGAKLVREMVIRDINHPSIVLWANGNEGGWNTDLDDDFALYDPQDRPVIHPWQNFNGIDTSHYERYDAGANRFFHGEDLIMPTEFLHGLYDGGHGAGLDDWWKLILGHPLGLGGFLWSFADEGIVREDQGGRIDVEGNSAPDGIVGPYREKEGSFFAIKEIWAPIYLQRAEVDTLPRTFDGVLRIENRYAFTNLDQLAFRWRILQVEGDRIQDAKTTVAAEGAAPAPSVPPGLVGELRLPLPADWHRGDILEVSATDARGREIYAWRWTLAEPEAVAQRFLPAAEASAAAPTARETVEGFELEAGGTRVVIRKADGQLHSASRDGATYPLRNGPAILAGEATLKDIRIEADGIAPVVAATYEGALRHVRWQLLPSGWLRLDYEYAHRPEIEYDYLGVTFDYDESSVAGASWLGKGPYRVWKNRLKGVEFGLWSKARNDTATGFGEWAYPEFKGFHGDVYFAALRSETLPVSILIASEDIALRLFTPSEGPDPRTSHVDFPPGDLSFLHGIAPIGTKFHPADKHGPQGQPHQTVRHGQTFRGALYFRFGE